MVDCIGNKFLDMKDDLDHFNTLVSDREKITKEGRIKPTKGMDPGYDQALADVDDAEKQLDQFLHDQQKGLKSKVCFLHS